MLRLIAWWSLLWLICGSSRTCGVLFWVLLPHTKSTGYSSNRMSHKAPQSALPLIRYMTADRQTANEEMRPWRAGRRGLRLYIGSPGHQILKRLCFSKKCGLEQKLQDRGSVHVAPKAWTGYLHAGHVHRQTPVRMRLLHSGAARWCSVIMRTNLRKIGGESRYSELKWLKHTYS